MIAQLEYLDHLFQCYTIPCYSILNVELPVSTITIGENMEGSIITDLFSIDTWIFIHN